jgi:hypothetical protein
MNEFFEIVVDDHMKALESVLVTLNRIDTYPLDIVDMARIGDAKRQLTREIESFGLMVEAARQTELVGR